MDRDRRQPGRTPSPRPPADDASDELLTPRLRLRRWQPGDAAAMADINRDPEVTRHLNRPVDEATVAGFYASTVEHWDRHGFGFYAVERRDLDPAPFVGFVGVAYPSFIPELARRPELGWRLARSAWGHGLATEAATATRDHAFAQLGLTELISVIHPDNHRSQRVAAKLGMTAAERVHNPLLRRTVDVWRIVAGGGDDGTRTHDPLLAKQVL
jgi:RimJ/RimL family protein N-acetyltransferase